MASSEIVAQYRERLNEARLYYDQGIKDGAVEILEELLAELGQSSLPAEDYSELTSEIRSALDRMKGEEPPGEPSEAEGSADVIQGDQTGEQIFQYGLALMDGLFYREAIGEFKRAAAVGYRTLDIWEQCGDCASFMEEYEEAIQYYNLVYNEPDIPEVLKRKILLKITKCSTTQRKLGVKAVPHPETPAAVNATAAEVAPAGDREAAKDNGPATINPPDASAIGGLLGRTLESWKDEKGRPIADEPRSYRILHPLHIGLTSLVVELEDEATGKRYAGQALAAPFNRGLAPQSLAHWVYGQRMTTSSHIAKVYDLAHSEDLFFIVRETLPVSLVDLLKGGRPFPIPVAVFIAHRLLEGLGDLHLHKGLDGQVRNIYHLDLRPSRILLHHEKPVVKIYNAGIWGMMQKANPGDTAVRKLPLPFMAYRAPEQFRTYLARRKPPAFTDIYQFGTIFYEMLTGVPAFSASSYEEYEIQHCEQYPTPPKVWRPEIPDQLNELIMNCLECDPMKRWRSATQVALFLEKPFYHEIQPPKDGSYADLMLRAKAA